MSTVYVVGGRQKRDAPDSSSQWGKYEAGLVLLVDGESGEVGQCLEFCVQVIQERSAIERPATDLRTAILEPFLEYVDRRGFKSLIVALAFMVLYKLGDNMATALSTPFYLDTGFSKTEIGLVAKNAALWPSIFGGIVGGLFMLRLGINKALWIFGAVQLVSILGYAWLAAWAARRLHTLQRAMGWMDRAAGALFIGFGLRLAFTDHPTKT